MRPPPLDPASLRRWAPLALPLACLLASIPLKMFVDTGGPLWLDEGWTLGIVQQNGAELGRQLMWDPNPPFYFLTLKAWTWVAGLSNGALRAPSVLAALCGPLFALTPGTGLERRERWLWAALLALWVPGVFFAQEARNYALLFAVECAACAAFLRLLVAPTLANAALWCAAASLALLTHQHALILGGLQGLAFLAIRRERAVRLWPAALLFLPAFAWTVAHAPRVAEFARPEFAWYPAMTFSDPVAALDFGFGGRFTWVCALALCLVGVLWRRRAPAAGEEERAAPAVLWAPAACAALGLAMVVVLGFIRPSFTFRYLTPYGPGLVLAIPLALQAAARDRAAVLGPVVMSFALITGALVAATSDPVERRTLQYEVASKDQVLARAPHVAFLWDNPTNRVLTAGQRLTLARAFFQRMGAKTEVKALDTPADSDPAQALYAAAPNVGDGFIWVYDMRVPRTAAAAFPPHDDAERLRFGCAIYAPPPSPMQVLACHRLAPRSEPPPGARSPGTTAAPR